LTFYTEITTPKHLNIYYTKISPMKRLLFALFLVFLVSFSVYAQDKPKDFDVKTLSSSNKIIANDNAIFDILITNNRVKDTDFFIGRNFFNEKWKVTADPYIVSVQSGFTKNVKLTVTPMKFLIPGKYDIIVNVESRDGAVKENIPLKVEVVPFGAESIVTELVIDDKIDPRLGAVARVSMENLFNYDIDKVEIVLSSELFETKREIKLKANEERIEKFSLDFDENTPLKNYLFSVSVKSGRDVLGGANKNILLSPYSEVTEKVFENNNFNKQILITKENTGTEISTEDVKLELTSIEKLLAGYNIKPDLTEKIDGKYVLAWTFSLEPGAKRDIIVTLYYGTYLTLLLLVILTWYIVSYLTKRKVVIVKKIIDVDKDREGIRGIKVILHLSNRGNKSFHKIRVIDYLPSMVAAGSKDFGTMRPSKVQRSHDGRLRLIWDLDGLDRGEERIISYVARSKLSIIGKMMLPEAVVEYHTGKRYVHVKSNRLTLLTRASEKERNSF